MAPGGGCFGSCLANFFRILGRGPSEPSPPDAATLEVRESPCTAGSGQGDAARALFQLLRRERLTLEQLAPGAGLPEGLASSLRARLDEVQAADLGVLPERAHVIASRAGVGYQEVYGGSEMTVCIFLLRKGGCLPLHDHPGMHVFGRLLFGRLRVASLDLEPRGEGPGPLWATTCSDTVLGPAPVTYSLSPTEGNLHELEALEDSAFLDVVAPPYDPQAGRDCTYYARSGPAPDPTHAGRIALVPTWPRDFSTELQDYRGPAFGGAA